MLGAILKCSLGMISFSSEQPWETGITVTPWSRNEAHRGEVDEKGQEFTGSRAEIRPKPARPQSLYRGIHTVPHRTVALPVGAGLLVSFQSLQLPQQPLSALPRSTRNGHQSRPAWTAFSRLSDSGKPCHWFRNPLLFTLCRWIVMVGNCGKKPSSQSLFTTRLCPGDLSFLVLGFCPVSKDDCFLPCLSYKRCGTPRPYVTELENGVRW